MCGIFCAFCKTNSNDSGTLQNFYACKNNLARRGPDYQNDVFINLNGFNFICAASVLWLQGINLNKQPIETEDSVFIYNGDIFNYIRMTNEIDPLEGDTKTLVRLIKNVGVFDTFSITQGPFAFVYLDKKLLKLYFGRDHYGRRSLLIGKCNDSYVISSIAKQSSDWKYIELPALGVFCFDILSETFELLPWKQKNRNFTKKIKEVETFLDNSVIIQGESRNTENITFRPPEGGDLIIYKNIVKNNFARTLENLLHEEKWFSNVIMLEKLLSKAVELRVLIQPQYCSNCISEVGCNHSLTGILFSGGVDCAILAYLCDKYVSKERPIDLLNVAFSKTNDYNTPDRETGLRTLEELQHLCPDRKWNFVAINVSQEELNEKRRKYIANLIFPLQTVLDDSLGCALWFASRGENASYKSTCRVILVGMGADELFGGYTKHRNYLKREGWLGLFKSLEDDWENLPYRNLARDDRVVSDHGRQLRTPYLDENFVEFVRTLYCWEKTYPTQDAPQGLGEKILLRSLAYKLGFKDVPFFKKRALQFGSRIANSKENANDISPRLQMISN